ncbi:unnamed protein product [Brachionus calyciflorus]|uniref:EF-hand domain-containing protein n=1 Tax=Brachionus calyciflorus TaxID=104777 RepID=A0A813VKS3_9BILA|nr:unnamed protein product [Brachionus calyciflorus]
MMNYNFMMNSSQYYDYYYDKYYDEYYLYDEHTCHHYEAKYKPLIGHKHLMENGNVYNSNNNSIYFKSFDDDTKIKNDQKSKLSDIKYLITNEKIQPFKLNIKSSSSKDFVALTYSTSSSSSSASNSTRSLYSTFNDIYVSFDHNHQTNQTNRQIEEPLEFEDDIEFLMANTGFNEQQIKNWHLEFQKKCPNGAITFDQFKIYYDTLLPNYLTGQSKDILVRKLFSLFDIDWDDKLNFSEFLISFWVRCKAPIEEKFTWIFNMIDLDRNGCLNYNELRTAMNLCLNLDDMDNLLDELNRDKKLLLDTMSSSSDDSDFCEEEHVNLTTTNNKRYDIFSRTSDLVDDKLTEVLYLMDFIAKNSLTNQFNEDKDIFSSMSTLSSFTFIISSNTSIQNFNLEQNRQNLIRKIQINREGFIYLCNRYKLLRKMIIPIEYFYNGNSK